MPRILSSLEDTGLIAALGRLGSTHPLWKSRLSAAGDPAARPAGLDPLGLSTRLRQARFPTPMSIADRLASGNADSPTVLSHFR